MSEPKFTTAPVVSLDEPANNPNRMDVDQFDLLVVAIKRVGFLQPVLVRAKEDDPGRFEIVDGVHRVRAAREAGLATLPIVVVDANADLAAALQIGMNQMRGKLDLTEVGRQLSELSIQGWTLDALTLTGFDVGEIDDLLKASAPDVDPIGPIGAPPETNDDDPVMGKPFVLEIEFATRAELAKAKRALKRAAGKGAPLGVGLLALIDGGA